MKSGQSPDEHYDECINPATFCYVCCDFEFGVQVKQKRMDCI